jgi:hypothetical protein
VSVADVAAAVLAALATSWLAVLVVLLLTLRADVRALQAVVRAWEEPPEAQTCVPRPPPPPDAGGDNPF